MNFIKIRIKGYIKNITDNSEETFDTNAIVSKNKINYIFDDTKYTFNIKKNILILIRENEEIKNILTFSKNRSILSEYIIKSNDIQLDFLIETIDLKILDNLIYIKYRIPDSNCVYEYKINIGG